MAEKTQQMNKEADKVNKEEQIQAKAAEIDSVVDYSSLESANPQLDQAPQSQ